MSILVTGGAGFIGSHFIERTLKAGDEQIVCLDSYNDYYDPAIKRRNVQGYADDPRVTMIEDSFCNRETVERLFAKHEIEHVVHLGAYAGVRPSVKDPFIYQEANVLGTLVLLEAVHKHPVKRFLLASSSTVYGRGAAVPFVEDAALGIPMSPYGATKRAAEVLGSTYFDLHGVPVVSLRLFSVYGPRLRPDLALTIFTAAIDEGRTLPLFGDGTIRRDFTHVSDICDGLTAALSAEDVAGEAINLGHNEPIEMHELIRSLEHALGKKAKIDQQPEKPGDMPITCADLTKAGRLLGYSPKMPFDEGLTEYVEWYRLQRNRP